MKSKKITREINSPVQKVFRFTINPKNTPLWIDSVIEEKTDSELVTLGTKYIQVIKLPNGEEGKSCAVITGFIENEYIEFSYVGTTYKCNYSYHPTIHGTILVYYEEAEKDEDLEVPMSESSIDRLKALLEGL